MKKKKGTEGGVVTQKGRKSFLSPPGERKKERKTLDGMEGKIQFFLSLTIAEK